MIFTFLTYSLLLWSLLAPLVHLGLTLAELDADLPVFAFASKFELENNSPESPLNFPVKLKILLLVAKFVILTLVPTLLLIWSTSSELWAGISSSDYLAGNNPSQLLYLLDNLPGKANDLLSTEENLVYSLTCNN
ncbi:hypothetical protein DSO57_1015074, partial [Entomophthora muscae]